MSIEPANSNTVLDQTEAWLALVFGGGRITIKSTDANIVLLGMNSESSANTYKPLNIGFGYSYILPILVSGLIARPGEIVIVENPEAHLHPHAQAQLMQFLIRLSTTGTQVFVESHSDHVLNALRVAVRKGSADANNANVLYFDKTATNTIVPIPIGLDGSIERWPRGFFDQLDSDYEQLFGV
jgi:predicted ATPase